MSIHWRQKWQCKPLLHGCHKIHIRPRVQHAPTSKHHIHWNLHPLNPNVGTFHLQDQPSQDSLQQRAHIGPYGQFMARRELIFNKIEKFSDKPESYLVWKGSFENMIKGVRIFAVKSYLCWPSTLPAMLRRLCKNYEMLSSRIVKQA